MPARRTVMTIPSVGTPGGTGTALAIGPSKGLSVQVFGTFSLTYVVEVSNDGTNWSLATDQAGATISAKTAAAGYFVPGDWLNIRLRTTAYTSGTVQATAVLNHI